MSTACRNRRGERRIELLGVDAGTVRALGNAGVTTIDALADLKADGPEAAQVRGETGFGMPLDVLVQKARARRSSLPGGDPDGQVRDVVPLPHAGNGQLPPHVTGAQRLVRVFLSVNFDYVENRVGAVAAHVTRSDQPLSTLFQQEEGRWRPDPIVKEQWAIGKDDAGRNVFDSRDLQGEEIVGILTRPWSGEFTDRYAARGGDAGDVFREDRGGDPGALPGRARAGAFLRLVAPGNHAVGGGVRAGGDRSAGQPASITRVPGKSGTADVFLS